MMLRLEKRRKLAIICGKLTGILIRKLSGGKGGTFPGYVARLIEPEILSYMAGKIRGKVAVTIGTNGKTTVNNLICRGLEAEGKRVVANRTGANMLNGVVSAFVQAAGWDGNLSVDCGCIEVDEFASRQILPQLRPDCVVITNIFRDQIDRYGEVDTIRDRIREAVSCVPEAVIAVNCDDFISYTMALECGNPVVTYGINQRIFDGVSGPEVRESTFCRFCREKLEYEFFHYGQLGVYRCPCCGWQRPAPDYTASNIRFGEKGYMFFIDGIFFHSRAAAPYNVYNTLSAYTAMKVLGALTDGFEKTVEQFDFGNDREGTFVVNGALVHLYLAKNPVGLQQNISLLVKDRAPKDIIFRINDNPQDGKDVSWLWDVDFQYLREARAVTIIAAGSRFLDMALRLKYEEIPCDTSKNIRKAVKALTARGTGNLYLIVNYTGLFPARRMLGSLQEKTAAKRKE